MVGKKTKSGSSKQTKQARKTPPSRKRNKEKALVKPSHKMPSPVMSSLHVPIHSPRSDLSVPSRPIFSIEIGSIGGDTTIGDLIVAFPRTRDVLMKHGLRFDVEEAGYLYMTLNVFSAIHGVPTHNLVQELHIASKEPPPQTASPPIRPMVAAPTT